MKNSKLFTAVIHFCFILMTLAFLLPFLIVILVSFTKESDIIDYGFRLIPKHWDLTAYKTLFANPKDLVRSIIWTIFVAVVQPAIAAVVQGLCAYPISRSDFTFKKPVNYFLVSTMMFSAGLVPAYIVLTNIYHLGNNPLIYFVTGWASCWGVILYRTFFQGIPDSLIEAAKIDGATELKVLWYVVLPMSKAIFGIQYFQGVLGSWGAYQTSMIYLTRSDMKPFWTFQYFLQRILQNNELIKQSFALIGQTTTDYPTTTLKYAMCVLSILPILVLFPYIQKYFSKGIAVGSVKG